MALQIYSKHLNLVSPSALATHGSGAEDPCGSALCKPECHPCSMQGRLQLPLILLERSLLGVYFVCLFVCFFETESHSIALDNLELCGDKTSLEPIKIHLSLSPED